MRKLDVIFIGSSLLIVIATFSRKNLADEITQYQFALNAYDNGDYDMAIKRFNELLEQEPKITNTALLIEIHKYLGASYMFKGEKEKAREHFAKLLKLDPVYQLDPVMFPIEVLDEFLEVKKQIQEELKKIEEEKEKNLKQLEEKRKQFKETWNMLLEYVQKPVYIRQNVKKNSLLIAFLPFGAGQFQNDHNLKGWLFFSFETLLLLSTVTMFIFADYYFKIITNSRQENYLEKAENFQLAGAATFWSFIGVATIGIVDSLIFFRKYKLTYERVGEKEIPDNFRIKKPRVPDINVDELMTEQDQCSPVKK